MTVNYVVFNRISKFDASCERGYIYANEAEKNVCKISKQTRSKSKNFNLRKYLK